jgi:hypothetical protein
MQKPNVRIESGGYQSGHIVCDQKRIDKREQSIPAIKRRTARPALWTEVLAVGANHGAEHAEVYARRIAFGAANLLKCLREFKPPNRAGKLFSCPTKRFLIFNGSVVP